MPVLETRAYAKLNLSLDVLDRRSDGYHEMRMVMQTVTLSDALRLETGTGKPLSMRSSLGFLPADERNLAAAAALRLCAETGADCGGLSIELDKSIPVCAGLAGVGLRGRNGMTIVPPWGTYLFLGTVLTDLPLKSAPEISSLCMDCGACLEACPSGALTLDKLEAMTCVCSVGLDMIAVPGDTPAETISAIIADEAAIGMVNSKTTAVRIIPAPGRQVGDMVEFGGLLGSAPVQPVHPFSAKAFVDRGGRIPAPMQSLKN